MRVSFTKIKTLMGMVVMLLLSQAAWSQSQSPLDIALRHLEQNKEQWKLSDADIADMAVSDQHVSSTSGANMIYLIQRHKGIEVYNAIFTIAISKEGKVAHTHSRIVPNVTGLVNSTQPSLDAEAALMVALNDLEHNLTAPLAIKERVNDYEMTFAKGNFSEYDIPVQLKYELKDESLKLAWDVYINLKGQSEYWSMRVDALTGEIITKNNFTISCTFHDKAFHNHDASCRDLSKMKIVGKKNTSVKQALEMGNMLQGGSYRVAAELDGNGYLHPHESPNHGSMNLLSGVEDANASPFGWHDTNGAAGPEYTITRGNNVHAYIDASVANASQGDEPDGGVELIFDFPMDQMLEPDTYREASVTNAFFMSNYVHDFTYGHGFDEAAGNYQQNNYGNGGQANDYIRSEIQDGSGSNNAQFFPTQDGVPGRMEMFLWDAGVQGLLTVESPSDVAGTYEVTHPTDWLNMSPITTTPLTAEVVVANDGSGNPTQACNALINDSEVAGKIALIDRGGCEFGLKILNAENAGAVGAIICNFENALVNMGAGAVGDQVTIPAIFMTAPDCAAIRVYAGSGLEVSFVEPTVNGPEFYDAGLDNGVIAHEIGHGISNRLIGGASTVGCIPNVDNGSESQGEGISDLWSLITSVKPGDTGDMKRGIGTYVNREDTDGRGIRRFPYSTDLDINPLTYADIAGVGRHARGELWTLMCWELYWLLVDEHGFDADLINGTGGNNVAVNLFVEGMKLAGCNPGFADHRDAIFSADALLYNGEHECLIWEAFAKRGLGVNADQGDVNDENDGIENFDTPPTCTKELKIVKEVTELVIPGEDIDVTLKIYNHKESTMTNVVVTDEIPAGTAVIAGSISNGGSQDGNMVVFNLGDMASLDEMEVSYQLSTDPNIYSLQMEFDDMEDDAIEWGIENISMTTQVWDFTNLLSFSGDLSQYVFNDTVESDQTLFNFNPITIGGDFPVLRFYHRYETELGFDGGMVQISTDGGTQWTDLRNDFFRNGYPYDLAYGTLPIPNNRAFSGSQPDFEPSYVDLTDYIGEDVHIRFRFATDANTAPNVANPGWAVDNFEILDMEYYEGQACVTSDEGDNACDSGLAYGTVIETQFETSVDDPFDTNMEVKVFPNPAKAVLNLQIWSDKIEDATVRLLTIDGKEMIHRNTETTGGLQNMILDVSDLAAGMYFVKVSTDESIVVEKVTIQ